jgi:DNA topoisomerase VI subunit B
MTIETHPHPLPPLLERAFRSGENIGDLAAALSAWPVADLEQLKAELDDAVTKTIDRLTSDFYERFRRTKKKKEQKELERIYWQIREDGQTMHTAFNVAIAYAMHNLSREHVQ